MARIVGGFRLEKHLLERAKGVDITDVLVRGADRVRTAYIDEVNEGGGTGKFHTPSLPGQAPNTDTGRLVGSVQAAAIGRNVAETSVEAEYAAMLEFGTDKMAPRPALVPTFNRFKPSIAKNIRRALKDG